MFKKDLKDFIVSFLGNSIGRAFSFIISIFIARVTSVQFFGMFNIAFNFFTWINSALVEIDNSFIKFMNHKEKDPQYPQKILGGWYANKILWLSIIFILISIFSNFINQKILNFEGSRNLLIILFFASSGYLFSYGIVYFFSATHNFRNYSISNILLGGGLFLTIWIFFKIFPEYVKNITSLFLIYTFFYTGIAILTNIFIILRKQKPIFKIEYIKKIFIFSFWLIIGRIIFLAGMRIDVFMLNNFVPLKEIGIYSSAQRIYTALFLTTSTFLYTFLPKTQKLFAENKVKIALKNLIRMTLLISVGLFILFGLSKTIIILLFGKEYSQAGNILRLLIISFIPFLLYLNLQILTFAVSKPFILFLSSVVKVASGIVSGLILMKKYGIYGACYMQMISNTLFFLSTFILLWKSLKRNFAKLF